MRRYLIGSLALALVTCSCSRPPPADTTAPGVSYTSSTAPFGGPVDMTFSMPDNKVMTVAGGNASACHVGCVTWASIEGKLVQAKAQDGGAPDLPAPSTNPFETERECLEACSRVPRVEWKRH